MVVNIDQSKPYLENAQIPDEARPNDGFQVSVDVGNRSTILSPQDGTCQSGILGVNVAWQNPVRVTVDGEVVEETMKCLDGSSGTKTFTTRLNLDAGEHTVGFQAIKVPGGTVRDTVENTVTVTENAPNPDEPTASENLTAWLRQAADALGGTTQQVAFGAALAVALLVLL